MSLGCLLVGFGLNLFFRNEQIVPNGIFGLLSILEANFNVNLALLLIIFNSFSLLIGVIFLPDKDYNKYMICAILIPISIILFSWIKSAVDLSDANTLLKVIFGAGIVGFGFKMIYKEDGLPSGLDILEEIILRKKRHSIKVITYSIDILLVILVYISSGIIPSMYVVIAHLIIEYFSKSGMLNSSDTKVFYIITSKNELVKDYIMNKLNSGITIFDVVGGYSKAENKVLMSAIKTKDYYKLREEIKKIDPQAFITITDTYEVINAELKNENMEKINL